MPDVIVEVAFAPDGIRRVGAAASVGCKACGPDAADGSLAAPAARHPVDREGPFACQGRLGSTEPAAFS